VKIASTISGSSERAFTFLFDVRDELGCQVPQSDMEIEVLI
jgi:hypothetical protein